MLSSIIPVNYWAILIAAVAVQIIGMIWYAPSVFGKIWMKENGIDPKNAKEMQKAGMKMMVISFLASLVTAYVLAHLIQMSLATFGGEALASGLTTAFWVWLGFIAPVLLGSILWEKKSFAYYLVNASYYLASLLVMGAILGYWL